MSWFGSKHSKCYVRSVDVLINKTVGEGGTLSRGVPWTIDPYKKSSVHKQARWRYMSPASVSVRAMQFLAILLTLTGSVWWSYKIWPRMLFFVGMYIV